jgi:hypothetical protein
MMLYITQINKKQKNPKTFSHWSMIDDGQFYLNIIYLLGILNIIVHNS